MTTETEHIIHVAKDCLRSCAYHRVAMSFDALPAEVLQRVFQFLDTRSIYRAQQVCSTWAAAVRSSGSLP